MAKILGLDLGTNSIGWAVVDSELKKIEAAGSRIIPMDASILGDFEKGNSVSQTKDRTQKRGARRLIERQLLRRERMHRVLRIMGFLPEHYDKQLNRFGKIPADKELKLAWREGKDGSPEFIYKESFNEMVEDFRKCQPDMMSSGRLVPYDWTIYYLRTKALKKALTKEELAWILLQFNQKRGYNQLRGKSDELSNDNNNKEYLELQVIAITEGEGKTKGDEKWYNIELENGWTYKRKSRTPLEWTGKTLKLIATYKTDKLGNRTPDQPSLSAPDENAWGLVKIKTEHDIKESGMTPGEFIYNKLLQQPDQKIIGSFVRTIDRTHYVKELKAIIEKQKEFIPELNDRNLYTSCIRELYPNNDTHRNSIAQRDFTYLLVDDILFFQRPLKSKKHLIANCPFETVSFVDKETGECKKTPLKGIAKSHPLYQEFRIWQFMSNLKIYRNNTDITNEVFPDEKSWEALFDHLITIKEIGQEELIQHLKLRKNKKDKDQYNWNYVEDKKYPCGETRNTLLKGLNKAGIDSSFLTADNELALWHILYSVDDFQQYRKALRTYATKQCWNEDQQEKFTLAFEKLTVCADKEYGAYSHKALTKLLPAMRCGKYWSADAFDQPTKARVEEIIQYHKEESDVSKLSQKEKFYNSIDNIEQCRRLATWQACYLVYGRHSETAEANKWESPDDIDIFLNNFRHHSLNNPIVEQVVLETLRTVRDIWRQTGTIDEIHIEMGREMKQTKQQREAQSRLNQQNEETNRRIRTLLKELKDPSLEVEGIREYSPIHAERLKLYEDGVYSQETIYKDDAEQSEIQGIYKKLSSGKNEPTPTEIKRYRMWLDQKYTSPYTGQIIPLGKLFTSAYEIEHVIPQSIFFDDSLSNKVLCESEVNKLKDKQLGYEFIKNHGGETVSVSSGKTVKILKEEEYKSLIERTFIHNARKKEKLLLDHIPESFTARQLNDSRYISKLMMHLLSNIVRDEDENGSKEDSVTSKNVIPSNGNITSRLKQDWGINNVWNRLILPRFERLNRMTGSNEYTTKNKEGHTIPHVPFDQQSNFQKKRIDHRHHAMDAIVIACTTRNHVNLMNNLSANSSELYSLQRQLRNFEDYIDPTGKKHQKPCEFKKPWPRFAEDTQATLQNIVVSFKQNLRVVNCTSNCHQAYRNGKKIIVEQTKGDNLAIRKPMHKDTVFGEVNLQLTKMMKIKDVIKNPDRIVDRQIKAKVKEKLELHYTVKDIEAFFAKNSDVWNDVKDGKIEVYYYTQETEDRYYATRKPLSELLKDVKRAQDAEKVIQSITDTGIQQILRAHLLAEGNNAEIAFSVEGLERMNNNIQQLNNGKKHQPIKRVRQYEKANKFAVGNIGNKGTKFVEGAKGTNLYFAIGINTKGERSYATLPLRMVIDLQKKYRSEWTEHIVEAMKQENMATGDVKLLYLLSPNDLVYVPSENQQLKDNFENVEYDRIYKVVSMSGKQLFCIPHTVATTIKDKAEFNAHNKIEIALTGESIKATCTPIKVDRLGKFYSPNLD